MDTKITKKAAIALIDRLWGAIQRCAEHGIDTDRRWDDLNKLTMRQEKEHVGFGRSLLGHEPERSTPLKTRARYFAVKAVLYPPARPKSWQEVGMYRDDIVAGAILRAMFDESATHTEEFWGFNP
jgi:hypothetical protein